MFLLPPDTPSDRVSLLTALAQAPDEIMGYASMTLRDYFSKQLHPGGFGPKSQQAIGEIKGRAQEYLDGQAGK